MNRITVISFIVLFSIGWSFADAQTFSAFVNRLEQTPMQGRAERVQQFFDRHSQMPLIEGDSTANFIYYGAVDTVLLNGNIQHWIHPDTMKKIVCGDSSFFYASYLLPPDARLDYQFIIRGASRLDPRNPHITPSGYGPHSELRMPRFFSTPYIQPVDSIPHGTLETYPWRMFIPLPLRKYALQGRMVKVYLPPGYDSLSNLPTVYIHDGEDAINFAHVPTILDNLVYNNKIVPVIAVFIPPVHRYEEYVGKDLNAYVSLICNELVPAIDRLYRTSHDPNDRAMMGISNGGNIALYTVLSRLDLFHNTAGQSSTITSRLRDLTATRALEGKLTPAIKIYFDCGLFDIKMENDPTGDNDFLKINREYSNLLSSLHVPHYFLVVHDGHEWANWRERMPWIFAYFFRR